MKKATIAILAAAALGAGFPSASHGGDFSLGRSGSSGGPWLGIGIDLTARPWPTAAQVIGFNLGIWSVSRFFRHDPWSYISFKTVRRNFETGLVWDGDAFLMNTLAHPLHGGAYYAIARSSGLSFWESVPFALGGSAMWEAFMENEPPSANDLLYTTLGRIYFGELLTRLSLRVRDGRSRGLERCGRELFAFVLNPIDGLRRLFRGDTFRSRGAEDETAGPLEGSCAFGRTGTAAPWNVFRPGGDPSLSLAFRSPDPFAGEGSPRAFDVFVHRGRFQFGKKFATVQTGYGLLAGTRLGGENASAHLAGIFLQYDFYNLKTTRLAGPSLGAGILSRFVLGAGLELRTSAQVGVMPVGTRDNPYLGKDGRLERDYDFGYGVTAKGEASLSAGRWGTLRLYAALLSLDVFRGTAGSERTALLEASYEIPIFGPWSIGLEASEIRRDSSYQGIPGIRSDFRDFRFFGAVKF